MPAYNEEKRIGKTLKTYSEYFDGLTVEGKLTYEIVIVINNTTDKTEEVVRSVQKKNKKVRYLKFKRGGKGFAVMEGFRDALKRNNDLIGFVDADMATSPAAFHLLIENIEHYDGAIADRYMRGAKIIPSFSFRRIVVSRVFNFLVRSLFGFKYRDTQCGAKLFSRKCVEKMKDDLTITQWAFDIDVLYSSKKNNFKIKSVPTIWMEMEGSKLNIGRTSLEMFFAIMQLRILRSPFKRNLIFLKPFISILYGAVKK